MAEFFGATGERVHIPVDVADDDTAEALGDALKQATINNVSSGANAGHEVGGEPEPTRRPGPIVVLVIGMAGTGKTTLMHRINLFVNQHNLKSYFINLDPAVKSTPFAANIDIRDTVNYKEVMTQYGLGPNGGILTSLNLFATRFDQVIGILERRAMISTIDSTVDSSDSNNNDNANKGLDYIFIDTPGQIEAFTWSAGGQIIQELLTHSFNTCVLYVMDTTRCASPTTFMSNMLYACSVLYKAKLPMICAFNKIDAMECEFAKDWMDDFEKYLEAVDNHDEEYMSSFNRSLALAMDEFYRNITTVGVSAATGQGMAELFKKIEDAGNEFNDIYLPELIKKRAERDQEEMLRQQQDLARLREDMRKTQGDMEV